MAQCRPRFAVAIVAALLLAPPAADAAEPGFLAGRLVDGKVPGATAGRAVVRAVRVADGRIGGTTRAGRSGAWRLALEPGWYVPLADVVRIGKRAVSAIAPVQRVRERRTTRMRLSLERTRTPPVRRKRRRARSSAATTMPVAVRNFTATGPNGQLGPGLTDMVIGSLTGSRNGDCTPTVVEWEHRAELQREIDLANSRIADPRSRIPRGNLLDPSVFVQGRVTTTATSTSWDIEIVDARTGDVVGSDRGSADGTAIFDAAGDIAQRLADQLCGGDYRVNVIVNALVTVPPYAGSGIATADVPVRVVDAATPPASWLGQAEAVFQGLQYAGVPGCEVLQGPHSGYVKVAIKRLPADLIEVTWGGETNALTTVLCPEAPPIPLGVPPIMPFQGTLPATLILPLTGGTQSVSGGLTAGGGGWINTGTVTVTRVPRGL